MFKHFPNISILLVHHSSFILKQTLFMSILEKKRLKNGFVQKHVNRQLINENAASFVKYIHIILCKPKGVTRQNLVLEIQKNPYI